MASKLKTDILETVSGSGTIALTNQLSGTTHASMPAGSVIQVVHGSSGASFTSSSTSFVELTHLRLSITTLSANSKILVSMNCAKQGNQSASTLVKTQILCSIDNYGASLKSSGLGFYPTWITAPSGDTFIHTAAQPAGTTITYKLFAAVNQGSFYAPDLWGVGGPHSTTLLQEIKT